MLSDSYRRHLLVSDSPAIFAFHRLGLARPRRLRDRFVLPPGTGEAAMPRYLLHLRDGTDEILDPEGSEFDDLEALRKAMLGCDGRVRLCSGFPPMWR